MYLSSVGGGEVTCVPLWDINFHSLQRTPSERRAVHCEIDRYERTDEDIGIQYTLTSPNCDIQTYLNGLYSIFLLIVCIIINMVYMCTLPLICETEAAQLRTFGKLPLSFLLF